VESCISPRLRFFTAQNQANGGVVITAFVLLVVKANIGGRSVVWEGLVLVSNNLREFDRIQGLRTENWIS
jgi:hypothetical protein